MSITIQQEIISGYPLLKIEGRLDAAAVPVLEKQLSELLGSDKATVLLDFSRVEYLSSAGMRLLLSITKKLKEQQGKLMLFCIREEVMEIIKLAGFEKILSIYLNKKEAVEAI